MREQAKCPALIITAAGSGHGKTSVTAAMARYHRNQGRVVKVFKTGPDFLDPMILERASENTVHQLDLWMAGQDHCRRLLYDAAISADLILIEGVMGLFDGDPSTADLSQLLEIPVAAVIDVRGTAQTFHAIAHGLATFRPELQFVGALANRVASPRHAELIEAGNGKNSGYLGHIPRLESIEIGERHLGLVQADEIENLDERLDKAASQIENTALAKLPPTVVLEEGAEITVPKGLAELSIAIARDKAFSFIYSDNLKFLIEAGATLKFFSPLHDEAIPEADGVYLPGGYPELYLDQLCGNETMKDSIRAHFQARKPLYAECGGMLYLLDRLTDRSEKCAAMVGLIGGTATMQKRLTALGYHSVDFGSGEMRGHTFHYSKLALESSGAALSKPKAPGRPGEVIVRDNAMTASYVHSYFRSNPLAAISLFNPS